MQVGRQLLFLFIGLGGLSAPAFASDETCRSIKDDIKRLACYDAGHTDAPAVNSQSPALPAQPLKSAWNISDSKSPIDDSPEVSAVNVSEDGANSHSSAFLVRCKEHKTEVAIASHDFWGLSLQGQTFQVLYRINNQAAVKQRWHTGLGGSGDMSTAFFPDSKGAQMFFSSLPSDGRIFFRLTDFQGTPHDMTFELAGVDEVKARVSIACKW